MGMELGMIAREKMIFSSVLGTIVGEFSGPQSAGKPWQNLSSTAPTE
jgi:hypothetical protein